MPTKFRLPRASSRTRRARLGSSSASPTHVPRSRSHDISGHVNHHHENSKAAGSRYDDPSNQSPESMSHRPNQTPLPSQHSSSRRHRQAASMSKRLRRHSAPHHEYKHRHDEHGSSHHKDLRRPRHSSRESHETDRDSSVDYHAPPALKLGEARPTYNRQITPEKYLHERYKTSHPSPPSQRRSSRHHSSSSHSPSATALLNRLPDALATYVSLQSVAKHAENAKDWVVWLQSLSDTPQEIQELSAKATTTRDTLNQVQWTIKARPDLVEGEQGGQLKAQIKDSIKSTDRELGRMTKLLSEISKKGSNDGSIVGGMQDFWRSYIYRDTFEEKVKRAEEDMQRELVGLSTLMVNIYSRALVKPAPAGSAAMPLPRPISPGSPIIATSPSGSSSGSKNAAESSPDHISLDQAAARPVSTISPPNLPANVPELKSESLEEMLPEKNQPTKQDEMGHARPPSPDTLGREEAALGSPSLSPSLLGSDQATVGSLSSNQSPADKSPADNPPTDNLQSEKGKDTLKFTPGPLSLGETLPDTQDPESPNQKPDERRDSVASELVAKDALLDAAWKGDLPAAEHALRHASIHCTDNHGLTPLHLASERDNLAMLILLLDHGAETHLKSSNGRTPLHLAARSATAPTAELLLERGKADPNALTVKGRTTLHYAASRAVDGDDERREVVRLLRDWGADPMVRDSDGETARDVAQRKGFWETASTLRRAERKWGGGERERERERERKGDGNWLQRHGLMK